MNRTIVLLLSALCFFAGCKKKSDATVANQNQKQSLQQPPVDTLVLADRFDRKEMDRAIARARAELNDFKRVLAAREADEYAVKAPVKDDSGTEHFWLSSVTFKDGVFHGSIDNEPGIVKSVKIGQKWSVKEAEISDWMYIKGEKIHGGYTIDPLLASASPEEAQAMRSRLVR